MFVAILLFIVLSSPKYYLKMAVPNRGTSGTCDQAVSALEAALEVCTLPFSMSMVYLIVALSLVPSTCTSRPCLPMSYKLASCGGE